MPEAKTEMRKIVRFLATDVTGETTIAGALKRIDGISFMLANAILHKTGINGREKIGSVRDEEIKRLEGFVRSLKSGAEIPAWLVNHRKDLDTGTAMHLHGSELELKQREDIGLMKRMRCYRGVRHEFGQPVRGQRTRSSFRTQKTVGVVKKKIMQAAAAKPATKKEEAKK